MVQIYCSVTRNESLRLITVSLAMLLTYNKNILARSRTNFSTNLTNSTCSVPSQDQYPLLDFQSITSLWPIVLRLKDILPCFTFNCLAQVLYLPFRPLPRFALYIAHIGSPFG